MKEFWSNALDELIGLVAMGVVVFVLFHATAWFLKVIGAV